MRPPILITGCARSGTCMIAGALAACGAWVGSKVAPPGPENPKGYFEHQPIKALVKRDLAELGADRLGVHPLPSLDGAADLNPDTLREEVLLEAELDGWDGKRPWLFKDAKLSYLWPLWLEAFPEATWVLCLRPPEQIAASCLRTPFMGAKHQGQGWREGFWLNWIGETYSRLIQLAAEDVHVVIVETPRVARGGFMPLRLLCRRVGLEFDEEAVSEFVDLGMFHEEAP